MSRLFVTPRELAFISDLTKEVIKDVVGQTIYVYPISSLKTKSHEVYNESIKKVFDNPIQVDALVDSIYQSESKIDKFGLDTQFKLEVFVQYRDLVDKGINLSVGDFFSFSDNFYEIVDMVTMRSIFGLAEHKDGIKLSGVKSRKSLFDAPFIGPTDISRSEPGSVQTTFEQQRGYSTDSAGNSTGDKRDLVENGVLEEPLTGVRHVSANGDLTGAGNSFYDE